MSNKIENEAANDFIGSETGKRSLDSPIGKVIIGVLIAWSVFQLWYASPIPFALNFGIFNEDQAKFIHLAFATFLGCRSRAYRRSNSTLFTRIQRSTD